MKQVQKFSVALLAMLAIGCGGGGNGSVHVPGGILNGTPRVEAIVKVLRTNLMHPSLWTDAQLADPTNMAVKADLINPTVFGVQDPNDIECNEQITFQLVSYASDGTRNILPGVTFVSSDATGVYGNLAGNTGDYLAGNAATPPPPGNTMIATPLTLSAMYNGTQYSALYQLKIDQVRVLGTVLAQGTNADQLVGTKVQFFNSAGALVDSTTVQFDGSFRASVPVVATSFTILADTIPDSFYHSFNYLGLQYDAGVVTCFAPLPTGLVTGTTSLAGTIFVSPRVANQGTPPSTGCSDSGGVAHIIHKR